MRAFCLRHAVLPCRLLSHEVPRMLAWRVRDAI